MEDYEPRVVAMLCNYCAYCAPELAGLGRIQYPSNVRIVSYPCTGKVEIIHILKTFEAGADIVFVGGCEVGKCHFLEGNVRAQKRVEYTKKLLEEIGLGGERLEFSHIAPSGASFFAATVKTMTERAKNLGPNPYKLMLQHCRTQDKE